MLLEEFDLDKYERSMKAAGKEEGIKIGIKQGIKQGIKRGTERTNKLTCILIEQNRIADLTRSAKEPEYQEKLFREFDL